MVQETRFIVSTLVIGLLLMCANDGFAQIGDVKDVNKDGLISDADIEIIVDHLDEYGTTDVDDDAASEFPFDDGDLTTLVAFVGPVLVLMDAVSVDPSAADLDRLWYRSAWLHKDVNVDGNISPIDALIIINYLNQ